jgi:hypothetical protein
MLPLRLGGEFPGAEGCSLTDDVKFFQGVAAVSSSARVVLWLTEYVHTAISKNPSSIVVSSAAYGEFESDTDFAITRSGIAQDGQHPIYAHTRVARSITLLVLLDICGNRCPVKSRTLDEADDGLEGLTRFSIGIVLGRPGCYGGHLYISTRLLTMFAGISSQGSRDPSHPCLIQSNSSSRGHLPTLESENLDEGSICGPTGSP